MRSVFSAAEIELGAGAYQRVAEHGRAPLFLTTSIPLAKGKKRGGEDPQQWIFCVHLHREEMWRVSR